MSVTIGYDSNPGFLDVRPVPEDLSDTTLILDADILNNEINVKPHVMNGRVTHQTLGTPIDVRVVETRVAHSWSIDQGGNFGQVFGTELVKSVDIRILELREELDRVTRSAYISQPGVSCQSLTMYFSSGEFLDRNCAKERWKCVASSYAGGNKPFKVSGASKLW